MAGHESQLREIFGGMESRFKAGALEESTSFYFSLGAGPGEKWTVEVGPEACRVQEGKQVESADCVLKTSPELFVKMVTQGYVPGTMDFMSGKIKSNDPFKLALLQKAFDFGA